MRFDGYFNFMKRKFLIIIILFSAFGLNAQGISVGLKGGANLSSLNTDNGKFRPGYQAGGFAELMITPRVGLQTEILYAYQNSEIDMNRYEFRYISIPILFRFNLNKNINLQLGPQYNMLIESKGIMEDLSGTVSHEDLYLAMGIGVDMPMGFNASLRFINGLKDFNASAGHITSNMVQFSVGVTLLDFKKRKDF